jgi:hypothetical protein
MRSRGQVLAALVVLGVVIAGALYVQREVGARPLEAAPPATAPSGAWFCPHGGGPSEWEVTLQLANPGSAPVPVRVRDLGAEKSSEPSDYTVEPGTTLAIPVAADGRERSTVVEYFGGWVAAAWVAHAGGEEGGAAAEPCVPDTASRWLLPDGATQENDDDYVVVMNPYATDAVISLSLLSERREPVRTEDWTNVTLKPFRSASFKLNQNALGETTVSTVIDVSVGRVAAASLGVSRTGGIRSSEGVPGQPPPVQILPGGFDQGRTDLVVASAGLERASLTGNMMDAEQSQPLPALADSAPAGESARTLPVTTGDPSTLEVSSEGGDVAFARRTYGVASDQGSTTGVPEAAAAWVVLPTVVGSPARPGLVLANPGEEAAEVTLSVLSSGDQPVPKPVTVTVPPGRTVQAPKAFVEAAPLSAILATATGGTFVPAGASYSLGREGIATYAVAVGVRIPDAWLPA